VSAREREERKRGEREREWRERERETEGGRERLCYAGACYFLEMVTHSIFSPCVITPFARTFTLQIQFLCPQYCTCNYWIFSTFRYNTVARTLNCFSSNSIFLLAASNFLLAASNYAHCVPVTSAYCVYVGVFE